MDKKRIWQLIGIIGIVMVVCIGAIMIGQMNKSKENKGSEDIASDENDSDENDSEDADNSKEEKPANSQFVMPEVTWRLAPMKYETNDTVVMGFDIRDFGVEPNSGVDVTNKIQAALSVLGRDGGGTLFLPEGQYIVKGKLSIPKGVTICGDWQNPIDNPEVKGTIICVYDGRGKVNGDPFITVLPNASVRNITFWYPEQKADDIVEYPATIRLYDPTVWGADYTHVKNCTFVNSYIAIKQGPNASNSPNVQNVYGTALYQGLNVDGLIDVGRFDFITFSPDFWAKSGLEGAPAIDGPHKDYIYANATGIILGRVDWSYFTNTHIIGYNTGMRFTSAINADTLQVEHNYPNGQVYRHTYTDCQTAIMIDGLAAVGESFAEIKIENCITGIHTKANSNAADTHAQFYNSEINATEYAVKQEGFGKLQLLQCTIQNGEVYSNNGIVAYTGCEFNTTGEHITLDTGTNSAILTGNTFKGEPSINNVALCKVSLDEQPVQISKLKEIPDTNIQVCKPAKDELYVVEADGTGEADATGIIQELLTKAGNGGGGIVFLPPGNYRIDGNLTVPTGVEFKGAVDLGRNPINLGSILQIYGGAGDADGTATVTLEQGSGIRGLVFNYPEQDYINIKEYPYGVRANGADIYAVNVSFRNGYNGLDFMTNRCDNHYVEYLAGVCLNNAIKIGGGSTGGKLMNIQTNGNCLTSGDEAKFGTWPNSISPQNQEANTKSVHKFMQENLVVFLIGDVTDELLFDNFSYFGGQSMKFVEENGKGASGWCVGQGIDYSTQSFVFEKIDHMQFINTQLVSFKNDYVQTDYLSQIRLDERFDGSVDFFNVAFWGGTANNIIVKGGHLNLYNGNIFNVPAPSMIVEGNASADLVNLSYNNDGDLQLVRNGMDKMRLISMTYNKNINTTQGFKEFRNITKKGERFAVPANSFNLTSGSDIYFAENFVNYPVSNLNGVQDALGNTDNFSEIQAPTKSANVSLVKDANGAYARIYSDNTVAQSYMYNHSMDLPVGLESSNYTVESRLKLDQICKNRDARLFCCMHNVKNGTETGTVLLFNFKNDFAFEVNNQSIATWEEGVWYRVVIDLKLADIKNKSYKVSLYDDNNKLIAASDDIPFSGSLQNNNDGFGAFIYGALSGTISQEPSANDILVDYVAVFRN
ncbi:MAG: hypothetical protein K0S76_643 [Herbinix sp.]|jgi:hypothetical protein|nr:hypothetical protein [Herbinix sp.]